MNAPDLPPGSIVETPHGVYFKRDDAITDPRTPWRLTGSTYPYPDSHVQRVLDLGATVVRVGGPS